MRSRTSRSTSYSGREPRWRRCSRPVINATITTVSSEQVRGPRKTLSSFTGVKERPISAIDNDRLAGVEDTMQDVAGCGSQSEPTDERLLHDYVASQNPGAFAAIMRRHGGMVFGVCRRILRREQDA